MKTAKKALAIILSIAMFCGIGVTNAFAAEIGDEIKWTTTYEDGEEYYNYYEFGGTLNEGENVIIGDYEGWYEKVYEFEAAQEGYYFITSDYWIRIAQTYQNEEAFNNAAFQEMYYMTAEDDYTWGNVYYLPAGTALIAAETYYDYENNVNIEYLGDISELTFDEESLSCNILGEDAYYDAEENYVEFPALYTVEFTNGTVLESDYYVYAETNGALVNGENAVTFTFLEYETEIYVDFYDITYFVESIELQKNDLHLNAKYYYDGVIEYLDLGDKPEYVTVNYTDGTSRAFEFYYGPSYTNNTIILPNGREVYVYAYLDTNDEGEICFVAGMADHNFIEEPCTIDGVSFSENFDHFSENLTYIIEDGLDFIVYRFEYMADALAYGDFEYFMYQLQRLFESPYLGYFFGEISSFINYYI